MTIDRIYFSLPNPNVSCGMYHLGTANMYVHNDTFTTQSYEGTPYEKVRFTFSSCTLGAELLPLTSSGTCEFEDRSGEQGLIVWAEFKIPANPCTFEWVLVPGSPPCTLKIVIKKS